MLDSKEKVRQHDTKDMLGAVERMPDQLLDGLRIGRHSSLRKSSPKDVVVCGMGGSAIGGHLLEEWLATESEIPCIVCSSYSLPESVGKDSLVIVASYSGNTEETISMFQEARRRRSNVVSIASGGKLLKMSEAAGVPDARIPAGMPPRASLGFLFGAMLGIIERSGIAKVERQVQESGKVMREVSSHCRQSVQTTQNTAKKLAHELFPSVPVVIGYDLSRPVAKRWANQFNENAKVLAHSSELPELDHNEIVGWMRDPRSRNYAPIFLDHQTKNKSMANRIRATKNMLGRVTGVFSVGALGRSPMAQMFSLISLGDYVSVYLGVLRNEDPSTNDAIDELKSILSKK